ncbi:acyltransferase [Leifsonia sp. LS1]|uniref:acyltransferase family protein n=1 Tax=Leifsonia sp. LS1 TaxID=2828483 RepID=UPI001CFDFF1A|nr:acyltransferase [Leifsonia sp. LS1]GIT80363.1 acyltransferase [Leifsonia sp. LS1]
MTLSLATRAPERREPPARRDAAVDLARSASLVVVVLLHALMVGVAAGAAGPVLENAMEHWPGFAALSWLVQVMPLFFVLGGFSSYTQWERMRGRGAGYGEYLGARVRRLFVPAAVAFGGVAVLLSALTLAGVPESLVAVAGFRMSQPLWFLGVYVLCTVGVPPMVALHRRAPVLGLLAPVALALAVDVVRVSTGVTGVGFANLVFVWLAVQQLGFWLADGRVGALRPRTLLLVAAGAAALLAGVCATGFWSFDMLANLNPPVSALVLLGAIQLALFAIVAPALRSAATRPGVEAVVAWISARPMTVYLWHMPVLIVLAGALLVSGTTLPPILSAEWWSSRPVWFAVVLIAVAGAVAVAGRIETAPARPDTAPRVSPVAAVTGAVAGASGVVLTLVTGGSAAAWVVAAALACTAPLIMRRTSISAAVSR